MIKNINKEIPVHYDVVNDRWIADISEPLSQFQLKVVAQRVFKINKERWTGLPPGDKKEFIGKALKALQEGRIEQRFASKKQGVEAFKSTEGTGKIILT